MLKRVVVACLVLLVCASPLLAGKRSKKFWRSLVGLERFDKGPSSITRDWPVELDTASLQCMECHDGSRARPIAIKHPDEPYQIRGHRTENHPVGQDYARYAARRPGGYMPVGQLDRRLQLVEGKVSCITCHGLCSNGLPFAMVASRSGGHPPGCAADQRLTLRLGKLCTACHIDK